MEFPLGSQVFYYVLKKQASRHISYYGLSLIVNEYAMLCAFGICTGSIALKVVAEDEWMKKCEEILTQTML